MTKRAWVWVAALLALVPGSTCHRADVQGTLDVPITLKQGQWVSFPKRPLEVAFLRVLQDTRCPKGVECIQQGDAVIQLQGKSAESGFDTFEARLPGRAAPTDTTIPWDVWSGYRFRVLNLEPYPTHGIAVDSSAYVVTILVRKS
jgi:hypothetical protein